MCISLKKKNSVRNQFAGKTVRRKEKSLQSNPSRLSSRSFGIPGYISKRYITENSNNRTLVYTQRNKQPFKEFEFVCPFNRLPPFQGKSRQAKTNAI